MASAFRLRAPRRKLEGQLQQRVAAMLRAYLPASVFWCASLSGVALSPQAASQAKAAGLNRGFPDLTFIFPDGGVYFVELKSEEGVLSEEQKRLQTVLGRKKMTVCRSWEEVRAVIGAQLQLRGLAWLTERESLARYAAEKDAQRMAKAKPLRRRLSQLSKSG
jgi:hypothetical protein